MSIISPHRSRERILGYGGAGCGKTKAAMDVVVASGKRGFVVDTDKSWDRMLDGKPDEVVNAFNVCDVRAEAFTSDKSLWQVSLDATVRFARAAERDDWIIVDMTTILWPWCQTDFSENVYGKELDDFFEEARKRQQEGGKKGGAVFDALWDWPTINRNYDRFNDAVLNTRAHVFLLAEQTTLLEDKLSQEQLNTYSRIGYRPRGNKTLDHVGQTVIHFTQSVKREYVISTAKDREREKVERLPWTDFAKSYLQGPAGWVNEAVWRAKQAAG